MRFTVGLCWEEFLGETGGVLVEDGEEKAGDYCCEDGITIDGAENQGFCFEDVLYDVLEKEFEQAEDDDDVNGGRGEDEWLVHELVVELVVGLVGCAGFLVLHPDGVDEHGPDRAGGDCLEEGFFEGLCKGFCFAF